MLFWYIVTLCSCDKLFPLSQNSAVETKVLGLFNNVAEVSRLRQELLKAPFIAMLR